MNPNLTCTRTVVVKLLNGLHLGPSSQVVQMAQRFQCDIRIHMGDRTIDAKSMLDLMTLAAAHGAELQIEAHGEDCEAAVAALVGLFDNDFNVHRAV
jgi:phosphocarrier protein HPr